MRVWATCLIVLVFATSVIVPVKGPSVKMDAELTAEIAILEDVAYIIPSDEGFQVVLFWLNTTVYITPNKDDAIMAVARLNDYWKSLHSVNDRVEWLRDVATN